MLHSEYSAAHSFINNTHDQLWLSAVSIGNGPRNIIGIRIVNRSCVLACGIARRVHILLGNSMFKIFINNDCFERESLAQASTTDAFIYTASRTDIL